MQAIQTRYLGPTNTRGSRIKAWCSAGSITIAYPHDLSGDAVHRKAALKLLDKLEWFDAFYGLILGGTLPNGDMCFVFNNSSSKE